MCFYQIKSQIRFSPHALAKTASCSRCQDARVGGSKVRMTRGLDPMPGPEGALFLYLKLHTSCMIWQLLPPENPPYPTGVETLEAFEATWPRHCSASHSICIAELVHASGMLLSKLGGEQIQRQLRAAFAYLVASHGLSRSRCNVLQPYRDADRWRSLAGYLQYYFWDILEGVEATKQCIRKCELLI